MVAAAHEELADDLRATVAFLVEIDFTVFHAEDAELRRGVVDAHLWQDVVHEIWMQRILGGKTTEVLSWHGMLSERAVLILQHTTGR
jgi:hypothetical protein